MAKGSGEIPALDGLHEGKVYGYVRLHESMRG